MSKRFPVSQLTQHAEQRLAERFQITSSEFLGLLNSHQGKRIGISSRTHLMHRLLWSPADNELLVAIQDAVDGSVLTVLTLEMYRNRYPENVTGNRVRRVVNRMVHAGLAPSSMWLPGDSEDYVTVYARLTDVARTLSLGRWRDEVESYDLSQLGRHEQFWAWVAERVEALGHAVGSLELVTAKFSGGDHQEVMYTVENGRV